MLVGVVVNIILDPVMIFGWFGFPAMGITGAGIATVTAQAVAAVAGLLLNLRFNHEVHINGKVFVPDRTVVGEIILFGILHPSAELCDYAVQWHEQRRDFNYRIQLWSKREKTYHGDFMEKPACERCHSSSRNPGIPCFPGTAACNVQCIR